MEEKLFSNEKNKDLEASIEDSELKTQTEDNVACCSDEKQRFYGYLVDSISRACDELYELCLNEPSLCLETSSFLQNTAYDFVTLNEWFKLKTLCKELPLPERRNSASSMCFDSFEAGKVKTAPQDVVEEKSAKKLFNKSANASSNNTITSDFPDTDRRPSFSDQCVQTEWIFYTYFPPPYTCEELADIQSPENMLNLNRNLSHSECSYNNPSESDYGSTLGGNQFLCSYIDARESYSGVYNTFCTPGANMHPFPSNVYSFPPNTFQGNLPLTPQYVPHIGTHFHVPYPAIPQETNSNLALTHMNVIQHQRTGYFSRGGSKSPSRSGRGRRNPHNINKRLPQQDNYRGNENAVKSTNKESKDSEKNDSSPFRSIDSADVDTDCKKSKETDCNHDIVLLPDEEPSKPSDTSNKSSSLQVTGDLKQDSNSGKQNIFGLAEDECLEHFPELSPEFQKKVKPKWNLIGSLKKTLEPKMLSDLSPVVSESISVKGASFSDVIKTPCQDSTDETQAPPAVPNDPCSSLNQEMGTPDWCHEISKEEPAETLTETPPDNKINTSVEDNNKESFCPNPSSSSSNIEAKQVLPDNNISAQSEKKEPNKKSRWSYFASLKKPLGHKLGGKSSPLLRDENVDKSALFSEVIKLSTHLLGKEKVDSIVSSNALQRSRSQSFPLHTSFDKHGVKRTFTSRIDLEKWLANQCSPEKDDTSDSDGWEIVKTRSKWRDSSERHQHNKHAKLSVPAKDNQIYYTIISPGKSFALSDSKLLSYENDVTAEITANSKVLNGFHVDNHLQPSNLLDKNLKVDNNHDELGVENQSNEGLYSSENSYEFSLNQSEATSPEDAKYVDEIDPNEMYSTYLKYLSNVEQGDDKSRSKRNEKILHPESERETSCNPASLEEMTDFVNKDPIRALDFKNKLDDQIRRQEDVKKKNEAKQQKAHKKRLQFLHDKRAKFRGLVQKVKEVKAAQDELALQRKNRLDLKLKKAEEKRIMHLNIIKRKAHDEEEKLKEIAFINELEAQNRRHDSLALRQEHEERLQCLVEERQRKLEEKAAKEAAVEERKKALEAERKEKLELMRERRRKKEEFIDRKQQEKEQERLVIAREKAREREERLLAIHTAQLANAEELQKRIQQKQEESHKRHIECIELIRQKAIEIGLHRNTADNSSNPITFKSGASLKSHNVHDKYKLHLKKRLKKIKSRMVMRGSNYIEETHRNSKDFTHKETILEKIMKKLMICELDKTFVWQDEYIDNVDHYLDDILFYLQEEPNLCEELKDIKAFIFFESVISTFNNSSHDKLSGPKLRCIIKIITICDLSCLESAEICLYFLLSNILATLLDSLRFSLQALELPSKSWDLLVELLLRFHSLVLDGLNQLPDNMVTTIPDFSTRMKDLMSYILCSGLVNRLGDILRPTIADEKTLHDPLIVPIILFVKRLLSPWFISEELINILKSTDLFGTVPLLYEGLMKHISNNDSLPDYCLPTIKLFLKLAELDLNVFQEILGADNIALQWRGIASGLMTYCVPNFEFDLLNIVIQLVGYFAIHNKKNQTLLQSGKQPTVLQQLVKLPFKYFCHPKYMELLFPTLISCSYKNATNRAIVENEVGYNGLEKFMKSEVGQNNKIIRLLLEEKSS